MLREARLKSAYAELYPTLSPDHWYTAAALAGLLTGSRIVLEGPAAQIVDRILTEDHFEFRGGCDRRGSWAGMRTRRLDRRTTLTSADRRAALRALAIA